MKMVDGSTVRHGRADCSYPESASRCGGHSDRHTGAVGAGGKGEQRRHSNEKEGKGERYDGGGCELSIRVQREGRKE